MAILSQRRNAKQPNAAGNAPPRTRLMRATLWAVAFSRLLDRPREAGRAPAPSGRFFQAALTLRITRPQAWLSIRAALLRVACMRLFGRDATLTRRGACRARHTRAAVRRGDLITSRSLHATVFFREGTSLIP
jgi:hypothetical protein